MSEPTTVAGQRYLDGVRRGFTAPISRAEEAIAAIEREAALDALEELRRVVGVLPVIENEWDSTYGPDEPEELVDRAAVLGALDEALADLSVWTQPKEASDDA